MSVRVEIDGLSAVLKNLDLTNKLIRKKVKDEIEGTALETADDIKQMAVRKQFPVVTGRLYSSYNAFFPGQKSVEYQAKPIGSNKANKKLARTTFVARLQGFKTSPSEISAAAGSNVEYAADIENGFVKSVGNHKLAHSFIKNRELMMRRLKREFS